MWDVLAPQAAYGAGGFSALILLEAPSPAYHPGMLRVDHRHAHEEETAGDSPRNSTNCTVASTCMPAPWTCVSCVRTARVCCTGICQPVPTPCSRPLRPLGAI